MPGSIDSICSIPSISRVATTFTSLQQMTYNVFEQIKDLFFQSSAEMQRSVDLHPLLEPGNLIEGGFWAGFCGLSFIFSSISLGDLYNELMVEHPASEKFNKISKAVKTAFVDLVSLGGAIAYNIQWAHEVKVFSLGQYAPLFKSLGYGASLIVNVIEGGWTIYNVYTEKETILRETSFGQREKHKQRLCLSLIKLIGNVSMVAWATLGIITLALGLAISPLLMSTLLVFGCIFSLAGFFYQRHIENAPEICPLPKFNFT